MKNPFIKESNSKLWIAAAVTGLATAGTMAWLYIKRNMAKNQHDEHATDYLNPKPGKHKKTTDLHDLHTIAVGN